MAKRVVDVLVPVALDRPYSYRAPAELELAPGDIVTVPLGPRETTGVVWAENAKPNPRLDNRLKDVEEKLEFPPLKPELRSFVDWVANYTLSARGMVLRMCLRMGEHLGAERERLGVRLAGPAPERLTGARRRVLALFADGMVRGKTEAAREAGVSAGVIDGLIDEGTLQTVVLPPEPVAQPPDPDFLQSDLTADQRAAAAALPHSQPTQMEALKVAEALTFAGARRGERSKILVGDNDGRPIEFPSSRGRTRRYRKIPARGARKRRIVRQVGDLPRRRGTRSGGGSRRLWSPPVEQPHLALSVAGRRKEKPRRSERG